MAEIMRYDQLEVSYAGETKINKISFSLKEGEILGIVGESGSGKSTLLKAVLGLLGKGGKVESGQIYYKEKNLLEMTAKERQKICGKEIGMIFQNTASSFCPVRKVGVQLKESMEAHQKISRLEFEKLAIEMFQTFGFENPQRILQSYPFELSGGMQQRVGIAAAMLLKPKVLLADEPTSALDVTTQKQVVLEMKRIKEEYGTSMLFVTHNLGVVRAVADRILVLKDGKAKEYGSDFENLTFDKNFSRQKAKSTDSSGRCKL